MLMLIILLFVELIKYDHDVKALLRAAQIEELTFNENKCNSNQTEICLLDYRVSHFQIQPDSKRLKKEYLLLWNVMPLTTRWQQR